MNSINNRLLEMKLRLECSGAEPGVVSAVWGSIENLDFGGLDAASLQSYFRCLDSVDQMEWIKYGGSQLAPESQRDILARQEAAFKLELVRRMDCEDMEIESAVHTNRDGGVVSYVKSTVEVDYVEIDGVIHQDERVISKVVTTQVGGNVVTERRVKSAFDVAMTEKFGSDWDAQLQNPRGSQSSGTLKVLTDCLNEKGEQMMMSSSRQYGQTVISLRPVEVAKHPSVEIDGREVLVHEPLENSIECGIMLKEEFESLKVVSIPMTGSNGDIAGGHGSREVFMVGLVPYVRHRQCRCADGWINVQGTAVHLTAWNSIHGELAAYCSEASDWSVMEAWLADCPNPLESYYSWKFPNKDPAKLAINAMAGVHSSRLTKAGLAPKIYVPHLDAMRRQQNCERFIQWNVDDQIRKLLGGRRNNSVENLIGDNDVSDYYDDIDPESGLTYLEAARKMLAKSWVQSSKNANREIRKQGERNVGKMYKSKSGKIRNGDKSCTVNGARSNVLTESTIWLEITCSPERVVAGFESEFANGEFIGEVCGNGHTKIVDAGKMEKLFTALGFNFVEFNAEEMLRGKEINVARKESVAGLRKIDEAGIDDPEFEAEVAPIVDQMRGVLEGDRGFAKGGTGLTKDDRDRMLKSYMIRLNDLSIESVYMDGDSPWLNIREHLFPADVTVLCRCVNMNELTRLQKARQLVEDCGMDVSDIKQILSAYRKPVLFRKMFLMERFVTRLGLD